MMNVTTIERMEITFDPGKDQINIKKHGMSLAEASRLDWDAALIEIDARREYGEVREIAYAPIDDRLYFVAFTRRDKALRIISLRKANQREFDYYVAKIDTAN